MKIDTLVLSSGGINGFMFIGAYQALKKTGKLNTVKHYIGCSAGAALSALMALKIDPEDIISSGIHIDICDWSENINNGMIHGQKLKQNLTAFLGDIKMDGIPGIRLTFPVCNISKCRTEYIDTTTHPDMTLVDAVIMSSSIPLLFPCFKYNGDLYVDGAVTDAFPLHLADNVETTLGIKIEYDACPLENVKCTYGFEPFSNILGNIFTAIKKEFDSLRNNKDYKKCLLIPEGKISIATTCPEQKVFLYHLGIKQTEFFIAEDNERELMKLNDHSISTAL